MIKKLLISSNYLKQTEAELKNTVLAGGGLFH